MKTLKFIVDDFILVKDPDYNFNRLIPGDEYLKAEFKFSSMWNNCIKVVGFYSADETVEYQPQILKDGKSCIIPAEALRGNSFKIRVFGKGKTINLQTQGMIIVQG